jgi:hypothetical protein
MASTVFHTHYRGKWDVFDLILLKCVMVLLTLWYQMISLKMAKNAETYTRGLKCIYDGRMCALFGKLEVNG